MNFWKTATIGWLVVFLFLEAGGAAAQDRTLIVHGFRNPVTGIELRQGAVGFSVGFYPATVDSNAQGEPRTTWFAKTGIQWFPFGLDIGTFGKFEPYLGFSLAQGLGNAWNVSESIFHGAGMTLEAGARWAVPGGLDFRLGSVFLVGFDGRLNWNPAPGIGWNVPLP